MDSLNQQSVCLENKQKRREFDYFSSSLFYLHVVVNEHLRAYLRLKHVFGVEPQHFVVAYLCSEKKIFVSA